MNSPAEWCVNRLKEADDYFLSSHELWKEYTNLAADSRVDYDNFESLLRSDKRLYVTRSLAPEVPGPQQEILRQMGFPLRAMVALADRKPPGEAIDGAIHARALQLHQALLKMLNAKPPGESEMGKKLELLVEETRKLCEALKPRPGAPGPPQA